jgi:hypothetical protein
LRCAIVGAEAPVARRARRVAQGDRARTRRIGSLGPGPRSPRTRRATGFDGVVGPPPDFSPLQPVPSYCSGTGGGSGTGKSPSVRMSCSVP